MPACLCYFDSVCLFEVAPPLPATRNLALNQPATQSSEGWSGAAARAVDGNTATQWGEASCTHTQNGTPEWWQVDLGESYHVMDFNLYHRTDCCQDRLIAANIWISATTDYSQGIICSASTSGGNVAQPETGTCGGATGQFITVQHSGDYITICEFEAHGSTSGVVDGERP